MPKRAEHLAVLVSACLALAAHASEPADHVNVFVGTDGHGHTFPGASLPFGMVQASPDTRVLGWDACSGYHYSDTFIRGFSHTHLSGVGIPDYCDVLVMPQTGSATIETPDPDRGVRGYGSQFTHDREQGEPGYYRVHLDDSDIGVELTTTPRVALHRYTFADSPDETARTILLDLGHRDEVLEASLEVVSPTELAGYRRSASWAPDQRLWFVIRLESPANGVRLFADAQPVDGTRISNTRIKALIDLADSADRIVQMKVALSPVSIEGARSNLEAELPGWDFDATRAAARAEWNRVLGRIRIDGSDEAQVRTFYTALYHAYLCPNLFSDVDGAYRGRDGQMRRADHPYYTVFSLWDTFRALHPLMTVLEPEVTRDFIRTFLLMDEHGGLLPVWDLAGNETFCMNGYHAVSVIADAWAKGIREFDAAHALEAMKRSAMQSHFGLAGYQDAGFVARDHSREGVSRTLEYAYDDWCIAQFAAAIGRPEEHELFSRRAQNYLHLFSPRDGFFRARENGGWHEPFDAREINFNYTEGNAWHYRFAVLHDVPGLINLFGGDSGFNAALDALFSESSDLAGRDQPDVAGLIGQYAHGNEPSHHVAYLYAFSGQPWKTQPRVREILTSLYSDSTDGLCGNEDCGQMSAWYVLSALGFYPVTPGSTEYVIGSPLFERATIELGGTHTFTITAENQSAENVYVASVSLNGSPLARSFITHEEIVAGGDLVFTMSDRPNKEWATAPQDRPGAQVRAVQPVVPAPVVQAPRAFRESTRVSIEPLAPADAIWFTLDGSDPVPGRARKYTDPFTVTETVRIAAVAVRGGEASPTVHAEAYRYDGQLRVTVNNPIHPQYTAGGASALVDGVTGADDFTTGRWQGYEDCDLDLVVDLGRRRDIASVSIGFLQDPISYILFPRSVEFEISDDGRGFRAFETVTLAPTPPGTREASVRRVQTDERSTARFLRIRAPNPGRAQAWGSSEMINSFLFCDEIQVDAE